MSSMLFATAEKVNEWKNVNSGHSTREHTNGIKGAFRHDGFRKMEKFPEDIPPVLTRTQLSRVLAWFANTHRKLGPVHLSSNSSNDPSSIRVLVEES
jgi:hypothetical protein